MKPPTTTLTNGDDELFERTAHTVWRTRSLSELTAFGEESAESNFTLESGWRVSAKDETFLRLMHPLSTSCVRRVYWSRLIYSFVTLGIIIFLMAVVQILIGNFYVEGSLPLHDVIHDLVGDQEIPDHSTVTFMCLTILVSTVATVVLFTNWHMRFSIAMRYAWLLSICYMFRMIAIFITTVPTTYYGCVPPKATDLRSLIIHAFRMIFNEEWGCADMILSGHSMMVTNCLMTWTLYLFRPWICWASMMTYGSFVLLSIITSHFHYSVDVFLGTTIAVGVHQTYHMLLDIMAQRYLQYGSLVLPRENQSNSFVGRMFLMTPILQLISWMEAFPLRLAIGVQHYHKMAQKGRIRESLLGNQERRLWATSDVVNFAYAGDGRVDFRAILDIWRVIRRILCCSSRNTKDEDIM